MALGTSVRDNSIMESSGSIREQAGLKRIGGRVSDGYILALSVLMDGGILNEHVKEPRSSRKYR